VREVEVKDYVLQYMKANDIPLTRANYIGLNWFGDIEEPDEPLPAELEAELPKELQTNFDAAANAAMEE
jgi:hypothetical protein